MAHDIHTKARAMADLLVGEAPRDVAAATRVAERTIRRWRNEAWAMVRASLTPAERAELAQIWSKPHDPMHRGQTGATCGAKTRSGGRCQNLPMHGKQRCRMHGGSTRKVVE